MVAKDRVQTAGTNGSAMAPAHGAFAVTPDDVTELATLTRGIYVGGAGNLKATLEDGTTVTFTAIAVGVIHPIRAKIIFSNGTTATLILGVY